MERVASFLIIPALVLTLAGCTEPTSPPASLRAGFAAVNITPDVIDTWTDIDGDARYEPEDGEPFLDRNGNGVFDTRWLAGFSQGRAAQGIHDSLYAIASVIDDGRQRLAMVALDAIGVFHNDVEDVRARIPEVWGIDHLVVASTHVHEVPDLMGMWGPSAGIRGVDSDYHIIPKSEWDLEAPFLYGSDRSPYGEENSVGPETARLIHEAVVDLVSGESEGRREEVRGEEVRSER